MSRDIKYLLLDLKWYIDQPNAPDYNGEYPPPMEWEQGEVKELLKYIEDLQNQLQQKENIIKEVRYFVVTHKLYNFKYDDEELFEIVTDKKIKDELLQILDKEDK